jgi:hypothetical protein
MLLTGQSGQTMSQSVKAVKQEAYSHDLITLARDVSLEFLHLGILFVASERWTGRKLRSAGEGVFCFLIVF